MTDESVGGVGRFESPPTRWYVRLDRLVREHRFTIAVVFPLVGAILLVASAEGFLPAALAFHPLLLVIGVTVMRSPLIIGLGPLYSRRVLLALVAVAGYTYLIEYIGIQTGWPYGSFTYGVSLGPMVAGIPIALPILFLPLVVNAYLLWVLILGTRQSPLVRIAALVPVVVLMDVILDPAAVALGFWAFDPAGAFYGVPLSNYLGWVLSAAIALVAVEVAFHVGDLRDRVIACPYLLDDLVSFVILWGAINVWFGQWIPAVVAAVLGIVLGYGLSQREVRERPS